MRGAVRALARARGRDGDEELRRGAAIAREREMPLEVAAALRLLDPDGSELATIEAEVEHTRALAPD